METGLREGLHFCFSGDIPVFLDLDRGRYFSLTPPQAAAFRAFCAEGESSLDPECIASLRNIGVLGRADGPVTPAPPKPEAPTAELVRDGPFSITLSAKAGLHLLAARRQLRRCTLKVVLDHLRIKKQRLIGPSEQASERLPLILGAFGAITSSFSPPDMCLPNSVALMHMLLEQRIPASLVLGVRTPPFAAHCWVQAGPTLLNDRLDNVRLFAPMVSV